MTAVNGVAAGDRSELGDARSSWRKPHLAECLQLPVPDSVTSWLGLACDGLAA